MYYAVFITNAICVSHAVGPYTKMYQWSSDVSLFSNFCIRVVIYV